jgi:hypothetical protein
MPTIQNSPLAMLTERKYGKNQSDCNCLWRVLFSPVPYWAILRNSENKIGGINYEDRNAPFRSHVDVVSRKLFTDQFICWSWQASDRARATASVHGWHCLGYSWSI